MFHLVERIDAAILFWKVERLFLSMECRHFEEKKYIYIW